jgi:hypothetical protein
MEPYAVTFGAKDKQNTRKKGWPSLPTEAINQASRKRATPLGNPLCRVTVLCDHCVLVQGETDVLQDSWSTVLCAVTPSALAYTFRPPAQLGPWFDLVTAEVSTVSHKRNTWR